MNLESIKGKKNIIATGDVLEYLKSKDKNALDDEDARNQFFGYDEDYSYTGMPEESVVKLLIASGYLS